MSEQDEGFGQHDLDTLLVELQQLLRRYPKVMQEVRVIVDIPDTYPDGKSSGVLAEAAKKRCDPPCKPPQRCRLDGNSLEYYCD
jgi:HEPN domain-containing protein